jgi:hypothetical protein
VVGMKEGWFTDRKLSDYITLYKSDFRNARKIVNGMDKADLIAGYAVEYDKLLRADGYGRMGGETAPTADVLPEPKQPAQGFWVWLLSFFRKG